MIETRRVLDEPMFLLHQRPYSETSLLMDGFSRNYGRVALIGKGVKQKKSRARGLLLPFQKLSVSWSGKGEVKTMINVDILESQERLKKQRLFCGYYINELVLRTLHRGEAHEELFDCYEGALSALILGEDLEQTLRIFEKHLLRELGYGLHLDSESETGDPIEPNIGYLYLLDSGPTKRQIQKESRGIAISGESLIALAQEFEFSELHRRELKRLTRAALDLHLGGRVLHSRVLYSRLFKDRGYEATGKTRQEVP